MIEKDIGRVVGLPAGVMLRLIAISMAPIGEIVMILGERIILGGMVIPNGREKVIPDITGGMVTMDIM